MAKVLKPPSGYSADSVSSGGGDWYDGPPPAPGTYKGVVKKLLWQEIRGEQRIMVLCEISDGKYKGAGVTRWFQLTEAGSSWWNGFLASLTDGSDAQQKAIRQAFAQDGFAVDDPDAKGRLPIVRIGKKTNPIGKEVIFTTKLRTGNDDIERAEIIRFIVRPAESSNAETSDDSSPEDALDGLEEFADLDAETAEKVTLDSDADDPWSI